MCYRSNTTWLAQADPVIIPFETQSPGGSVLACRYYDRPSSKNDIPLLTVLETFGDDDPRVIVCGSASHTHPLFLRQFSGRAPESDRTSEFPPEF
jgi:hypothetical protein